MITDKNRKYYITVAQKALDLAKTEKDTTVIFEDDFYDDNEIYIDSLVEMNVLKFVNPYVYSITAQTQPFVDNGGHTAEELKTIEDDRRADRALRYSKYANLLALFALIIAAIALFKD